nr:MAG: hypothetical protein DIU60_02370 [Actinomycetota bacterium]
MAATRWGGSVTAARAATPPPSRHRLRGPPRHHRPRGPGPRRGSGRGGRPAAPPVATRTAKTRPSRPARREA